MPILTNSIGAYTFDVMSGAFQPQQERVEVVQRPGVDGTELRRLGSHGVPFPVVTERYETTRAQARTVYDLYHALIGANPVAVTQHGVAYPGTWGVLNVENLAIAPRSGVVGLTIVANPTVVLVVRWTLIQVTTS